MENTNESLAREKVEQIILQVFGINPKKWSETQRTESLFSRDIGFGAIDLMVLFRELETQLDISFEPEDVTEQRFDVYENIISAVERKLAERKQQG